MIDVEISGPAIPRFSRREIRQWVSSCVQAVQKAGAAPYRVGVVSVALVDDAAMQRLNRKYRHKNRTTDVLTFPAEDFDSPESRRLLGDIVVCVDQAKRQASAERHSLATEVRYLLLHGVLHAYGYDHETDGGDMDGLEQKLRGTLGLQ